MNSLKTAHKVLQCTQLPSDAQRGVWPQPYPAYLKKKVQNNSCINLSASRTRSQGHTQLQRAEPEIPGEWAGPQGLWAAFKDSLFTFFYLIQVFLDVFCSVHIARNFFSETASRSRIFGAYKFKRNRFSSFKTVFFYLVQVLLPVSKVFHRFPIF